MIIRIDPHTLERAEERGASEKEIEEVIKSGFVIDAKYGRTGKAKIFNLHEYRHGRFYEEKRIEVFYIIEKEAYITVTVYVFYGKWEEKDEDKL